MVSESLSGLSQAEEPASLRPKTLSIVEQQNPLFEFRDPRRYCAMLNITLAEN
jgi:hypothetical protein